MHEAKLAQNFSAEILSTNVGGLRAAKLSHRLADRLRAKIFSGELAPGSKLPGENELSSIYRVSRPTVREALRIIEAEALIELGRGMRTGAVVRGPNMIKMTEYTAFLLASDDVTLADLHAARGFFEPEIIRRLGPVHLRALTPVLRVLAGEIKTCLDDGALAEAITGSKSFHSLLARAAPNRIIGLLTGIFQNISDDAYAVALLEHRASAEEDLIRNLSKTVAAYGMLCNLLDDGGVQEAARFWQSYMERSQAYLNKTRLGQRRIVLFDREPGSGAARSQLIGVSQS